MKAATSTMKRKQLIKQAQDIPKDVIRQQVEFGGRTVKDHFLTVDMGTEASAAGTYSVLHWGPDGKTMYYSMDDDAANNLAVAQYLIDHGAPVYQSTDEVPAQRETKL